MSLRCPSCNGETTVYDSRPLEENRKIRRRRKCDDCGHRITTYEMEAPAEKPKRKRPMEITA